MGKDPLAGHTLGHAVKDAATAPEYGGPAQEVLSPRHRQKRRVELAVTEESSRLAKVLMASQNEDAAVWLVRRLRSRGRKSGLK